MQVFSHRHTTLPSNAIPHRCGQIFCSCSPASPRKCCDGAERGLNAIGVLRPDAIVGAMIATLVLMPEFLTSLKAARLNHLQHSINAMLGSALASMALTIPAVVAVCLFTRRELILGLDNRDATLLVLALTLCIVSFGTGRTNVLTGIVHLAIFFAYLMLPVIP